jgi:hypothetical protein
MYRSIAREACSKENVSTSTRLSARKHGVRVPVHLFAGGKYALRRRKAFEEHRHMVTLHLAHRRPCLLGKLAVLEEQPRSPFLEDNLRNVKLEDALLDTSQQALEVTGFEMRPAQNTGIDDDVEDFHGLSRAVG